jgi:tetratricopeptide (TPR) repeat protein
LALAAGLAEYKQGQFQAAVKGYPKEPNAHFGLGYLHWKSRQYDYPKSGFESELSIVPNHPQALAYLGDIEMKRNDPEKVLALLQKAVRLRNDIRIAYLDLGSRSLLRKNATRRRSLRFCVPRDWIQLSPTHTSGGDVRIRL